MTARQALAEIETLTAAHPDAKDFLSAAEGAYPLASVNDRPTVGFIGQLNDEVTATEWLDWAARHPATHAGTCRYGIASFRVDAYHLDLIDQLPMGRVDLASKAVPHLERARVGTRVDSVHAGLGMPQPFHGEGVLIGVLDWGFDYTHPNFYDTTLTSTRIRGAWDQYRQSGPAPAGFDYGTVAETPEELMAMGSDTANVYSYSTHGTHVAGIAGGSGCDVNLHGMAPAAEFLFATLMVDEASSLDAFAWMQDVAEADGKRLVINNSWGLPQWGTPDGTALSNQFIDAMSEEGVVFVSSNGNNGDSNFHLDHTFAAPGDTVRSLVNFYSVAANPNFWGQNLTLWGEPGETFSMNVAFFNGSYDPVGATEWVYTADGPDMWEAEIVVNGDDTVLYDVVVESAHPANGRPFVQLRVNKGASNANAVLQFTAPTGRVHAWNHTHLSNDVGNWGQDFTTAGQPGWVAGDPFYGTLDELRARFEAFVCGVYHRRPHGSTGEPPITRWQKGGFLPAMPDSLEQLDMLLVHVPKPRKVLRDGIRLMGRRYVEPTLAAFVGEQVEAVYDPRDLTEIHVYHQGRFVCRALSSEHAGHPSLRAIQRARRGAKERDKQVPAPTETFDGDQEDTASRPPTYRGLRLYAADD